MNIISFDDFKKIDIRTGTIIEVERVPNTRKLYKIRVDLGERGVKQTISSLVGYYTKEELLNKRAIFLANLEPAKFAGETSEGMLLAAEMNDKVVLLTTDKEIRNGAKIT
ncbi:tRNA-binding protein [Candidatus Bathyarchaeota archaeon]|nr:tRNA-binding protein [Candidatus Bathyarchaeota archaeon]